MRKRRLSLHQQRTLSARRQQAPSAEAEVGLLLAQYGARAEVENSQGQRFLCQLRQNLRHVVCGDQVHFVPDDTHGVITHCLPRRNFLGRPDRLGKLKPIAANIDQMVIVVAPKPAINTLLLDSYLVIAETLNINAIILLNKADLLDSSNSKPIQTALQRYESLGYSVHSISVKEQQGIKRCSDQFHNRVQIIVGQSGVGKSSLIQLLIPGLDIRTGALTKQANKGSHTTTTARYYHGPMGDLIDSPGIREIKLWHMEPNQVAQGFREFRPYLTRCKFRDCQHEQEMGCTIQGALAEGKITPERYQNYKIICQKL